MSVSVILLEKVEKLGGIGDIVSVKPGFARNYLLPQSKALRATEDNIAYFEKEKAAIEKVNADKRKEAETQAKAFKDLTITLIRQASEGGQLYGSVAARDISEAVTEAGTKVKRGQVNLNQAFKTIGLFNVEIALHPEVVVSVQVNIARSESEAKTQLETGKPVILDGSEIAEEAPVEDKAEEFLDENALEIKQAEEEAEAQAKAEEEAKKAEKEAAKQAEAAASEEATEADAEIAETETEEEVAETEEEAKA